MENTITEMMILFYVMVDVGAKYAGLFVIYIKTIMPKVFLTDKEEELICILRKVWQEKKIVIINQEQVAEELSFRNYKIINHIKNIVPFGSFTITTHAGEGVKISHEEPVKYI